MKLSVCMILKNEGKTIMRCLDSLKGFVDEYVIGIDDTTNDNTRDEVKKFFENEKIKHIVYDYTWENDFSKARNEGMDKATGDYILIIDGHEYFPDEWYNITEQKVVNVKSLLVKIKDVLDKHKADSCYFQLYQQPFIGAIPNNFFMQPRIYRNGYKRVYEVKNGKKDFTKFEEFKGTENKIRFGRAAHNTIKNTDLDYDVHFNEIILLHDAPPDNRTERKVQRVSMNVEELKKMIKKNPKDLRAYFYLGNTYMEAQEWNKAINAFEKYLKKIGGCDNSEKYQVLIHKALCHQHLEQWTAVRDSIMLAIGVDSFRKDGYILLGDLYFRLKHLEKALQVYTQAINLKPKSSRMFQNGAASTYDAHQKLAFTYAAMGNIPKAVVHLQAAMQFLPNEKWEQQLKEWRDNRKNVLIIARGQAFITEFYNYMKSKKEYNVIITDRYDFRLAKWADYIWSEWGNDNAHICSKEHPEKTVVRIHGWEAYGNIPMLKRTSLNKCKAVVFVADHIMKKVINDCNLEPEKIKLIPNGVNTDKLYIKKKKRDVRNVGYAGFLNVKKGTWKLAEIIKANPEYVFNLRVDWQDPYLRMDFERQVKDCKNIVYHGWYEDLNDFWNQMTYVLSTSIVESFSYNVAEGMACGCKPLIYNWWGAKDIYPQKYIFDDMPHFSSNLINDGDKTVREPKEPGDKEEYRQFILDTYPLDNANKKMEEVLIDGIKAS